MYKGKPIFHSVGNLVFMPESVETLPRDFMDASGLPLSSTSSDFQNMREGSDPMVKKGFTALPTY